MKLSDLERKILETCCESNESCTILRIEGGKQLVYHSRFFEYLPGQKILVIDEPSAETPGAKPLAVDEDFEVFFQFKDFRYMFKTVLKKHSFTRLGDRDVHSLEVRLPDRLDDGERREYFRIDVPMNPPVIMKFNVYKKGSIYPIYSQLVKSIPEEFQAQIVNISGGGFSFKPVGKHKNFELERGDIIKVRFKLTENLSIIDAWFMIRNKRKYHDSDHFEWGTWFIEDYKRNPDMKKYRNRILRYVTERQREILFSK